MNWFWRNKQRIARRAIKRMCFVTDRLAPEISLDIGFEDRTTYDSSTQNVLIGYDFGSDIVNEYKRIIQEVWFCDVSDLNNDFISLLHEIGHHFTYHLKSAQESDNDREIRTWFSIMDEDDLQPELIEIYYNLPKEAAATDWLVTWVMLHPWKAKFYNWLLR